MIATFSWICAYDCIHPVYVVFLKNNFSYLIQSSGLAPACRTAKTRPLHWNLTTVLNQTSFHKPTCRAASCLHSLVVPAHSSRITAVMTAIHYAAAALALTGTSSAFSPPIIRSITPRTSSFNGRTTSLYNAEIIEEDLSALSSNPTLNLLPAGKGFSASMERVLQDAAGGYYRAKSDESVIDVMEGITSDVNADVALVFEGEELKGLFTDSDYIKVCSECAKTSVFLC